MKKMKRSICLLLTFAMLFSMQSVAFAAEGDNGGTLTQSTETTQSAEQTGEDTQQSTQESTQQNTQAPAQSEGSDDQVVITENDKPYLALGADLTADQQHTVLALMGIGAADLDKYDVVYVNNSEEHKYLDDYLGADKIGTRSLSSVVIVETEKGSGIDISTYNINYCTVGMYKNALATAGVTDAKIIIAGPTGISGTAALVGIFKAYEEMTGEEIDEKTVDAALDELVTTGQLEEALSGVDSENLEAMIAELKAMIANGELDTDQQIRDKIQELAEEYEINLTDEDIQKLVDLLQKLKGLDLDWDAIANQASAWADKLGELVQSEGFGAKVVAFFQKAWDWIKSLFS